MIESSYSLYKLIILHMLHKTSFPLSDAQISEFMIGQQYTSYFHLREVIGEMEASGLITKTADGITTYYSATEAGIETLQFFREEISPEIRGEFEEYMRKNGFAMRSDSGTQATYRWQSDQGFIVNCTVKEGEQVLLDFTLTVPSESIARTICENWKARSSAVYENLLNSLTR